jgi:hypothetical protein
VDQNIDPPLFVFEGRENGLHLILCFDVEREQQLGAHSIGDGLHIGFGVSFT